MLVVKELIHRPAGGEERTYPRNAVARWLNKEERLRQVTTTVHTNELEREEPLPTRLVVVHDSRLGPFRGEGVPEDTVVDALLDGVDDSGRSLEVHVGDPKRNHIPAAVRIPLERACGGDYAEAC